MTKAAAFLARVFDRAGRLPLIGPLVRHRFTKFGSVGLSGTVVNLAVLYLAQQHLFRDVHPEQSRITLSLSLAIACATVNNFVWNRVWTWKDRNTRPGKSILVQFLQYVMSCWLAIVIQFVFTKLFAIYTHYLVANILAIALAGVLNYLINDAWTFRLGHSRAKRAPRRSPSSINHTGRFPHE